MGKYVEIQQQQQQQAFYGFLSLLAGVSRVSGGNPPIFSIQGVFSTKPLPLHISAHQFFPL